MPKPEKLNSIQENYLQDVELLQALGYPLDLFDDLYKIHFIEK